MKNLFLCLGALLAAHALTPSRTAAQVGPPNLLLNGNFDTQYASGAPTREQNIKNTDPYYLDQLPNWQSTTGVTSNAAYPSTNSSTYVATNAAPNGLNFNYLNPATDQDPYAPNSGIGNVRLLGDHDHKFDGIITQQVSLTAGHTYSFSYYVRRQAYSSEKAKVAFCIVYSSSVPGNDANPAVNDLVPAPAVRMRSDYITLDQWVKVSGSFIAPTTSTSAWVTLGFDNSATQTDSSLPAPVDGGVTGSIHLVLDDVSLQDMGCLAPPTPQLTIVRYDACQKIEEYNIDNYNPALTYKLTISQGLISPASSTPSRFIIRGQYRVTSGSFTLTATSACGKSSSLDDVVAFENDCPRNRATTNTATYDNTAYPNPASESLTVPDQTEGATVLNSQGVPVLRLNGAKSFDIRSLPNGLYNLQMKQGGKLINQRIEVKH